MCAKDPGRIMTGVDRESREEAEAAGAASKEARDGPGPTVQLR